MVDPALFLEFTVQSNFGVYAPLLHSGLSPPSGIPACWDMALNLNRILAARPPKA